MFYIAMQCLPRYIKSPTFPLHYGDNAKVSPPCPAAGGRGNKKMKSRACSASDLSSYNWPTNSEVSLNNSRNGADLYN